MVGVRCSCLDMLQDLLPKRAKGLQLSDFFNIITTGWYWMFVWCWAMLGLQLLAQDRHTGRKGLPTPVDESDSESWTLDPFEDSQAHLSLRRFDGKHGQYLICVALHGHFDFRHPLLVPGLRPQIRTGDS